VSVLSLSLHVPTTPQELFSRVGPADESVKEKAEAFKQQGNTHLKLNKFKEAVESYGKAIDLDPTNATYFCNRAAAYIKLQELQKALEDCKQAVSLNPSYARAFGRMGYARCWFGVLWNGMGMNDQLGLFTLSLLMFFF